MSSDVHPALQAVSDAVLAVAAQRSVDDVLQQLVERARELAGARYAALGVPDDQGGFSKFLVAGMTTEEIAALGPMPRVHGMLGAVVGEVEPFRMADIQADPRFRGWWPDGHPDMHSFLGVPIVYGGAVLGAFYLTGKAGADAFDDGDEQLISLLAAHAAIAITNARLLETSAELSRVSERNRLALELHDVVSQKLFSLVLSAEAAGTLLERDAVAAGEQLARVQGIAKEALEELRALILSLRPPELEHDGLAGALRKHVEVQRPLHPGVSIDLVADPGAGVGDADAEVLRIAQEALHNALRHADAARVAIVLEERGGVLRLEVADDGAGFDVGASTDRLGLISMRTRADRLGATFVVDSEPGLGTVVTLEVPGG